MRFWHLVAAIVVGMLAFSWIRRHVKAGVSINPVSSPYGFVTPPEPGEAIWNPYAAGNANAPANLDARF
jgi:hypothetical protein